MGEYSSVASNRKLGNFVAVLLIVLSCASIGTHRAEQSQTFDCFVLLKEPAHRLGLFRRSVSAQRSFFLLNTVP